MCRMNMVSVFVNNEVAPMFNLNQNNVTRTIFGKFAKYIPIFAIILENAMANAYTEISDNTYDIWDDSAYVPPSQSTSTNEMIYMNRKKGDEC
jgi:hypothetical protein